MCLVCFAQIVTFDANKIVDIMSYYVKGLGKLVEMQGRKARSLR